MEVPTVSVRDVPYHSSAREKNFSPLGSLTFSIWRWRSCWLFGYVQGVKGAILRFLWQVISYNPLMMAYMVLNSNDRR